jgi:hypothetical protein
MTVDPLHYIRTTIENNQMRTLAKFAAVAVLSLTMTSCFIDGLSGVKGNKKVVTEDRKISNDFEVIKVQQGIHLYLTQGTESELRVEADENIIDLLMTEVNNGVLKLYFEKNVYRAKARNVYLTADQFNKIKTSSGAHVRSENTLALNTLHIDSSSGSSVKVHVTANEISSSSSSGADIDVFGKSDTFSATASSGSSIDADELEAVDVTARVSSGANIDVNASGTLNARASSGGDIDYSGNPKNIDKSASSGGSVRSR